VERGGPAVPDALDQASASQSRRMSRGHPAKVPELETRCGQHHREGYDGKSSARADARRKNRQEGRKYRRQQDEDLKPHSEDGPDQQADERTTGPLASNDPHRIVKQTLRPF